MPLCPGPGNYSAESSVITQGTSGHTMSAIRSYGAVVALCLLASIGMERWLARTREADGNTPGNPAVVLGNFSTSQAVDLGQRVYERLAVPGTTPAFSLHWRAEAGEARNRGGGLMRFWSVSAVETGSEPLSGKGELLLRFNADTGELVQCNLNRKNTDLEAAPLLELPVVDKAREYLCRLEACGSAGTSVWRLVGTENDPDRVSRQVLLQRGKRLASVSLSAYTGDLMSVRFRVAEKEPVTAASPRGHRQPDSFRSERHAYEYEGRRW